MYGGELLYFRIWHDHSAICAHYRYHVIHHSITYMHAWLSLRRKGNSRLTKLLGRLSYKKKKSRGTITHLDTWRQDGHRPPQQIPHLNFLDFASDLWVTDSQRWQRFLKYFWQAMKGYREIKNRCSRVKWTPCPYGPYEVLGLVSKQNLALPKRYFSLFWDELFID